MEEGFGAERRRGWGAKAAGWRERAARGGWRKGHRECPAGRAGPGPGEAGSGQTRERPKADRRVAFTDESVFRSTSARCCSPHEATVCDLGCSNPVDWCIQGLKNRLTKFPREFADA